MKKITLVAVAALVMGSMFTSCKKDYTCDCKDSAGVAQTAIPYTKVKKADAKKACDALNTTWTALGGSCTLN
jgi:hypothetical protein